MDKLSFKLKSICRGGMIIIASASLYGCSLLPVEEEPLKPPLVQPAQENYATVAVQKGSIVQSVRGNGSFESYFSEAVQFTTKGGRIKEVLVKAGDTVKKGDVLIHLNMDDLDIELKQLQLQQARSKQALGQAKLGKDAEQIHIAELQYEIDSMKYERLRDSVEEKKLVAGMDGKVTFVDNVQEGDIVDVYRTLVMISDPDKLRIAFQASNSPELGSVGVGFSAIVKLSGNVELEGKVTQTPSSAPQTDDTLLRELYSKSIYVEVADLPDSVDIGTRAEITIILQQRDDVLKIPRSGLRNFLGRTFVRVLEDGNKIREIDVETGIQGSTEIEITEGLEEGMLIVLP